MTKSEEYERALSQMPTPESLAKEREARGVTPALGWCCWYVKKERARIAFFIAHEKAKEEEARVREEIRKKYQVDSFRAELLAIEDEQPQME
jgi:beta-lactamase class D